MFVCTNLSLAEIVTVTATNTIILVEIAQNINKGEMITIDSLLISAL